MIQKLRLQHLRLYADMSFAFDPGVNILVGPNASGKTTVLEMIHMIARGKSYKARDAELVQFGQEWSRIDATLEHEERTIKLEQTPTGMLKKTYTINQKPYVRLVAPHLLPIVLFEPTQLQLVTTEPDLRRSLVDDLIEQVLPSFATTRRNYRRSLTQRNSLLKLPHATANDFFVWNLRMSEFGGVIARERQSMLERLNARLSTIYSEIAGVEYAVQLSYVSHSHSEQYETSLLKQLEERIDVDRERGFTSRGPHRDDIAIHLNGQPLQAYASRGETRTLLLALKVIEALIIEEVRQQRPIMLFDDVFGELDGRRRQYLTEVLRSYQTFITTTDADIAVDYFGGNSNLISLVLTA